MRAVEPMRMFGRRASASRALVGRASVGVGGRRAGASVRIARVRATARGAESRGAREDDDEARRRRRREGLAEGVMAIMLGKKIDDRGEETETRSAVRAGRFKAAVGACVLAGAVGGGFVRVGRMPSIPEPALAVSAAIGDRIDDAKSNGTYIAQRVFGWPLYGKVFIIMSAMVPLVLAAASLYRSVSGEEWGESIAKTFYWLNDVPGADSTAEENWKSVIVAQLIVFCGMFTFAILIGVVSDEIASKVDEVKTGNSKVYERNHTVILNWNNQLIPLLKQVAVAKSEGIGFKKPVVVLADRDKEEMDAVIEDELSDSPPLSVVTRQGRGYNPEDLQRVNAWAAERVVVLHDADEEDLKSVESHKASSVLNLRSNVNNPSVTGPNVIIQVPQRLARDEDFVRLAVDLTENSDVNDGKCCFVNGTSELTKLKAFSIMQPGGSKVFADLMLQSAESSEFYTYRHKSLAGKTFREVWRMFSHGTVVGLTDDKGTMVLGPRDDDVVGPEGQITVVANDLQTVRADIENRKGMVAEGIIPPPGSQHMTMRRCPLKMPAPRKIYMLGWNDESPSALSDMLELAPPGSSVTIISDRDIDKSAIKGSKNCSVRLEHLDAMKRLSLERARVHNADAVLIMPPSNENESSRDSQALATIMQIAHLASNSNTGRAPHIVTELSNEVSKSVAEDVYGNVGTIDVILRDNLIGGALLQVSANLKLAGLFDFLLEKDGKELYMRPYDEFVTVNDAELHWGVICERARERDEIAIGVMRADGELSVSPSKDTKFRLYEGDQVIVLAEEWWTYKSLKVKRR